MENETKFRAGIVMSLLGLVIMTFEFFEKDRAYQEIKVSSSKQIDSLQNEIKAQEMVSDHFNYLWEQMKELHPKDAEKIEHETE
jgi:hypothetical protein